MATACLLPLAVSGGAIAQQRPTLRPPATRAAVVRPSEGAITAIRVEGNQRIEQNTILSYMLVQPGDPFDPDRIDRSLKTLYATGLFQDVRLDHDGDILVVHVAE